MIDDKQIEEAAYRFATSQEHGELLALIDGYKEGYKDAINEFLKDLLHPADEEPNKGKFILMEMRNRDNYAPYWVNDGYHGNVFVLCLQQRAGFILMICSQRKEAIMIKQVTMYSVVCDRCGMILKDGAVW